jgi:signal transduction histidine kinase
MSLRLRLTLWVAVLFLFLQTISSVVAWLYQRAAFNDMLRQRLVTRAKLIEAEFNFGSPSYDALSIREYLEHEYARDIMLGGMRFNIITPRGSLIPVSEVAWPEILNTTATPALSLSKVHSTTFETDWFRTLDNEPAGTRAIALPVAGENGETWAVVVAASTSVVSTQISMVSKLFLTAGIIGLLTTTLSGWYVSRLAVAPLHQARTLADQIRPESISRHLNTNGASGSELKALSEALDRARERMRHAFAAQERFLSNISHEIKTPIATLLIEAQTMDRTNLSKPAAAFVRTTEEEMRRLGRLVESFLTLTRIQDGKGLSAITPVPVNELVIDSVAHCSPMARQYSVRLRPELIEDDAFIDASIAGEPDLLRTMVDNLVRNAIRFSPQDGSVNISASVHDNTVYITVSDEGPGLPADIIANIFDRFVQSPEELRKGRGHGLGLTIAQAVAELHGGKITVKNREPAGAEFTAQIPLRSSARTLSPPERARTSAPA